LAIASARYQVERQKAAAQEVEVFHGGRQPAAARKVAEIAAASREQSSGIEQVNKAVMQMDTTTQQNAALVEEAAAASQAIVEQAQALTALVSRYDVGGATASVANDRARAERRAKDRPWSGTKPLAKAAPAPAPVKRAVANNNSDWSEF